MTLIVHVPGSAAPLTFDDTVTLIPIGRDPDACRNGILIPEDQTEVGRVHCTIERVAGYYRLALNKHHAVLINGKLASDGQELGDQVDLQLGPKGPKLVAVTQLSGKVKPTSSQFQQKGQATHLRESETTARRGKRLAAIAIVLLFVAGMIGLAMHGQSAKELEKQKQQIAAVAAQTERLSKLEDTMKTLAPSVYLMGVKDPRGGFSPEATAWVIDQGKGILATNGHVGQIFFDSVQTPNKDQTEAGYQFIARSTDKPVRDYVIDSVQIHPGFSASQDLYLKYQPVRRTSEISVENMDMEGPFCDVALLFVKDPTGLGPALTLADQDELQALDPGDDVALIGFPMENVALGGVTVDQPTPKVQFGHVVALTDYFEIEQTDFPERLLLEHSIPATGGASGSPILNSTGHVVAFLNAGNAFYSVGKYYRLPSAALINYGQRSDVVRELLNGTADSVQKDRTAQWEAELSKNYVKLDDALVEIKKSLADREKRRMDTIINPKVKQLSDAGFTTLPDAASDATIDTFVGMRFGDKHTLARLDRAGQLTVLSWLPDSDQYDEFDAYRAQLKLEDSTDPSTKQSVKVWNGDLIAGDNLNAKQDPNLPWFWSSAPADVKAGDLVSFDVKYSVTPKAPDESGNDQLSESCYIQAFFKPTPVTPANTDAPSHRQELASQWITTGAAWVLLGCKPVEIQDWTGTVSTGFAVDSTKFDVSTSSDYLFVVNTGDGSDFSFDVSGHYADPSNPFAAGTDKVVGSGSSQSGWATVAVNVTEPKPVWFQTSLTNAAAGTTYEVYVYHPGQ